MRAADKADAAALLDGAAQRAEHLRDDLQRTEERVTELHEQRTNLTSTVERLAARVAAARGEMEAAVAAHERVERQFLDCAKRIEIQEEERAKLTAKLEQAVAEIARLEGEMRQARPVRKGPDPAVNGRTLVTDNELLSVVRRFGQFSVGDIAATLKMAPKAASAQIMLLVEQGVVQDTGMKFAGKKIFEFSGAAEEAKEHEAESLKLVRDFAVETGKPFAPSDVEAATDVGGEELVGCLQELLRKGIIEYAGFDDLELYAYVPPKGPGAAAIRDMQRRRMPEVVADVSGRGETVAGTGAKWRIPNDDVRMLVQAVERLGGTVRPAGNGHYEVTHPNKPGKRVLIAGTPRGTRSVRNDTARIRRELDLQGLSI